MNTFTKTLIASGIAALSINAQAESSSPFTYLEYSVGTIDYDNELIDDGDYSSLAGSLELPFLILPLLSLELNDYDDFDVTKIGTGTYLQFEQSSYLYGLVHYNDYEDDIDSDFSLRVGFRHYFTDSIVANASYTTYTDHDFLDETKLSVSYYLHPNFSVSANYALFDDFNIASVGARLSF